MKKALIILISVFSLLQTSYADDAEKGKLTLTLVECINMAQNQGPSATIAKKRFKNNVYQYKAFKANMLPQINFTTGVPGLVREIRPITQPDGSDLFKPQSQLFSSANLQLSQIIPQTGTEIYLSSGVSRIDLLENNQYFIWRNSPLQLSIVQPLFKFNDLKWNKRIQEIRNYYYDNQYSEAMEKIAIDISGKFFDVFLSQMSVKNAKLNLANNDTLYNLSKGRFKVGTIAENDLLHSEMELTNAQNNFEIAKLNYQKALDNLRLALGIQDNKPVDVIPPFELPDVKIDYTRAMQEAKKNSSTLINLQLDDAQAKRNLEQAKSRNSFNASITASYGLNNSSGKFDQLYMDLLDQERFNLTFSIPIFQWGKGSSEIEAALANQYLTSTGNILKKREFEINVKYQILQFDRLKKQVGISARSDTIAIKRFEIAKNRFMIGKIDMNALFIAQREKDGAFISYIQTLRSFWAAYYNIRKLTLFDFVNNKEIIYPYNFD